MGKIPAALAWLQYFRIPSVTFLILWTGLACGMEANSGAKNILIRPALSGVGSGWNGKKFSFRVYRLRTDDGQTPGGLSGLTTDSRGRLWSVAERRRVLVRLTQAKNDFRVRVLPLRASLPGRDTESVTSLADGFLLGTERRYLAADSDEIIFLKRRGDEYRASARIHLPYGLWNTKAVRNRGIEGLCVAGAGARRVLLAVSETVLSREGRRVAPMAIMHLPITPTKIAAAKVKWKPFALRLTSRTGKISGLHCSSSGKTAEAAFAPNVLAIERHYGVRRVLGFKLPGSGGIVRPRILLDLKETLRSPSITAQERRAFNPEGITRLPDGAIAIIGDNSSGGIATLLILIQWKL